MNPGGCGIYPGVGGFNPGVRGTCPWGRGVSPEVDGAALGWVGSTLGCMVLTLGLEGCTRGYMASAPGYGGRTFWQGGAAGGMGRWLGVVTPWRSGFPEVFAVRPAVADGFFDPGVKFGGVFDFHVGGVPFEGFFGADGEDADIYRRRFCVRGFFAIWCLLPTKRAAGMKT